MFCAVLHKPVVWNAIYRPLSSTLLSWPSLRSDSLIVETRSEETVACAMLELGIPSFPEMSCLKWSLFTHCDEMCSL